MINQIVNRVPAECSVVCLVTVAFLPTHFDSLYIHNTRRLSRNPRSYLKPVQTGATVPVLNHFEPCGSLVFKDTDELEGLAVVQRALEGFDRDLRCDWCEHRQSFINKPPIPDSWERLLNRGF